jgi:HEPN domain-containing protein
MIQVDELDSIARARLDDARALLAAGRFDSAMYFCGYAVELALKARICRTLDWSEFPSTGREFQAYRSFQTHDLEVLLHLSGQEARLREDHLEIWSSVAEWSVDLRYNPTGTARQTDATAMIRATEELLAVL